MLSTTTNKHVYPLGNVCSDLVDSCTYHWKALLVCGAVFPPINTD